MNEDCSTFEWYFKKRLKILSICYKKFGELSDVSAAIQFLLSKKARPFVVII